MSFPCKLCGVRPDVACRHRPAEPAKPKPILDDDDQRKKPIALSSFVYRNRSKSGWRGEE